MNKERLWTKDFIVVSVTNFLILSGIFLLMVIMASYAVDKYRASTGIGGLVSGIFIIGILIGRLGTGRIIEDVGSRKVLITGTLLYIITSALYFAAINLPLLILMISPWVCFWGSKHRYGNYSRSNNSSRTTRGRYWLLQS